MPCRHMGIQELLDLKPSRNLIPLPQLLRWHMNPFLHPFPSHPEVLTWAKLESTGLPGRPLQLSELQAHSLQDRNKRCSPQHHSWITNVHLRLLRDQVFNFSSFAVLRGHKICRPGLRQAEPALTKAKGGPPGCLQGSVMTPVLAFPFRDQTAAPHMRT